LVSATEIANTALATLYHSPHRPVRPIVRRLYAYHYEKGKQSLAVNIERGGQIPHFFVGVVQVRLCQGEQLLLQGNRFPKELTPIDRLRIPRRSRRSPRNRYQRRNSRATTANASRPNGCAERLRASSAIPRISR